MNTGNSNIFHRKILFFFFSFSFEVSLEFKFSFFFCFFCFFFFLFFFNRNRSNIKHNTFNSTNQFSTVKLLSKHDEIEACIFSPKFMRFLICQINREILSSKFPRLRASGRNLGKQRRNYPLLRTCLTTKCVSGVETPVRDNKICNRQQLSQAFPRTEKSLKLQQHRYRKKIKAGSKLNRRVTD